MVLQENNETAAATSSTTVLGLDGSAVESHSLLAELEARIQVNRKVRALRIPCTGLHSVEPLGNAWCVMGREHGWSNPFSKYSLSSKNFGV